MANLKYLGPFPSHAADLADQDYVNSLTAANLTVDQINALCASGFSTYATKDYVDQQDLLNATQDYIDTKDDLRLPTARVNVNNGVPGLDANTRIDVARVNRPSSQRFPKGVWSPSAYNADTVTATTTESQLYPVPVSDPGFPYKLIVTGHVDACSNTDTQYPIVRVRAGSMNGAVVASGKGIGSSYSLSRTPAALDSPASPGAMLSGAKSTTFNFSFTATAGAMVVVIAVAAGTTIASCTYGGVAMTNRVSKGLNNNTISGQLAMFTLANAPGGQQTVVVTVATATTYATATAISYRNIASVSSPQTASSSGGTSASQTAAPSTPGQILLQAFGSDQDSGLWTPSGGTNRFNNGYKPANAIYYYGSLAVNEATESTTFGVTATSLGNSAAVALSLDTVLEHNYAPVIIIPDTTAGPFTGANTFYVTLAASAGTVTATTVKPSLNVLVVPA